jgi:hypothetical protein
LVELIKNIAVIDLFRNGSGLAADIAVLSAIFYKQARAEIEKGLEELSRMRVALFKKHIGAWSVFEGSDFDIDAAIAQNLGSLAWSGLQPPRAIDGPASGRGQAPLPRDGYHALDEPLAEQARRG